MRMHPLDNLVLGDALAAQAKTHRDEPFLKFRDGENTYGEVDQTADRVAQGLLANGMKKGDHVALMMSNSAEFLYAVFALARLGAVAVPINTAYRGTLLRHVLDNSEATVLIVDSDLMDRITLKHHESSHLRLVVVNTDDPITSDFLGLRTIRYSSLLDHGGERPETKVLFSDLQAIMYTSGTTGPSKGAMVPHSLALTCAADSVRFVSRGSSTIYSPLPLFHAAGLWDGMMAALITGTSIAIVDRFSASRFWEDVRHFGAGTVMGVFSMIPILLNQPRQPDDLANPLKTFYMGKSSLDEDFMARFGAHTVETYTSTEIGIGTASPYGAWRIGSMGQANEDRFEVAVVDEHDRPLGPGDPGELVVRPHQPDVITRGYLGRDDATAETFRNLWFHTGDRAYVDDDGYYYFLDRMDDSIRRSGENISAFDLESGLNLHPGVLESAAIAVPSDLEEDEVKIVVVGKPGANLDEEELIGYCDENLPDFMVPRYVELVDSLPRTPTDKVAKHKLREMGEEGLTATTWDRVESQTPDTGVKQRRIG
ncbi:MAG: AMP-binding protein [Acidimicrobiia bacterium]|nr:AMP-binding protein [Acidimicrobiia bacterium]